MKIGLQLLSFQALPFVAGLIAFCSVPSYKDIYFEYDRFGNTQAVVTGTPGYLHTVNVQCQASTCAVVDVPPPQFYGSPFSDTVFSARPDSIYGATLRVRPDGWEFLPLAQITFTAVPVATFGACPAFLGGCISMDGQEELAGEIGWYDGREGFTDRIYVEAVTVAAPEPSSLLLLATMLGGSAFTWKKRIRASGKP